MIIDKYNRMVKIWAGTTWSEFIRRSIGKGRREFFYELAGFRKKGAIDKKDVRDHRIIIGEVSPLPTWDGGLDGIDAHNIVAQNQGRKPWCVAYATAHHMSHTCTKLAQREITFEGIMVWGLMVKWELCKMGDNGTLLRNGVKAIQKECNNEGGAGFIVAQDGSKWFFEKYDVILLDEHSDTIRKGYSIITGQMIQSPMCDKNNVLLVDGDGGHAFLEVDEYPKHFTGLNSWYRWGIKLGKTFTNAFWIPKITAHRLFYSSFILLGAKEVE